MVCPYPEQMPPSKARSADKERTLACSIGHCYALTFNRRKLVSATVWKSGKEKQNTETTSSSSLQLLKVVTQMMIRCSIVREEQRRSWGWEWVLWAWRRGTGMGQKMCLLTSTLQSPTNQLGNTQSSYNRLLEDRLARWAIFMWSTKALWF